MQACARPYVLSFVQDCAYGESQGRNPTIDPQAWTIVDHRLTLNLSKRIREKWEHHIPGTVAKADAVWATISDE